MPYQLPVTVLAGKPLIALPQAQEKSSYTNLAAAGSVALSFGTIFSPLFDVYVRVTGVDCTLQGAVRFAASGDGSTFRDLDPEHTYTVVAGEELVLTGVRLPGIEARWTLTAGAGAGTASLEFHIVNRSG